MVFLVGFYFLNILDANIDAHLLDYNVDENLSFQPSILDLSGEIGPSIGIKINYIFKWKSASLVMVKWVKWLRRLPNQKDTQ